MNRIIMIDNFDSFTYNVVQYLGELGGKLKVFRNNETSIQQIKRMKPDKIVISPGPCTPKEAGISNDVIREFNGKIPILGICLGHQCIGYSYGAKIVRAKKIMHGKTSEVKHKNDPIYKSMSNPFIATRYHSLLIDKNTLPKDFIVNAWTSSQEIMGIKHKNYPTWGVQFHPESIMTKEGKILLKNFLSVK